MERYVDLLIVDVGGFLYVVEVGIQEADVGDLVEFEANGVLLLGYVAHRVWCERDSEVWIGIDMLRAIYPAKQIYRPKRRNDSEIG